MDLDKAAKQQRLATLTAGSGSSSSTVSVTGMGGVSEGEQRVAEEYLSSLSDLNCNSKPLINMLTMLAEENIEFAHVIVKIVGQYIAKVITRS